MSLTRTFGVFGAVDQAGLNTAIATVCAVRPHYLHYGSPPFVASSSVQATGMAPITFPGVPGGIAWAVDFTVPVVDLHPADTALPAPLTLGPDQLTLSTTVTLTVGCVSGDSDGGAGPGVRAVEADLAVVATGHPVARYFSPGVGDISFAVDQVLIDGVAPPSLAALLDCLVRMLLDAALRGMHLPFDVIGGGFFKLALLAGPDVADDRIQMWGEVS